MRDYQWLHEYCLNRFGSVAALEARLPQPKSPAELAAVSDDRYLSLISLRIFRAGLNFRQAVRDAREKFNSPAAKMFLDFISDAKRSICSEDGRRQTSDE